MDDRFGFIQSARGAREHIVHAELYPNRSDGEHTNRQVLIKFVRIDQDDRLLPATRYMHE